MRKTYRYKHLLFPVENDKDVYLTVKFISKGNSGTTIIDVPSDLDPELENSGTVFLGKGKDLRTESTLCFSDFENNIPEEDKIQIEYKVNNVLIEEHYNEKSEAERVDIILKIKFPEL